MIDIYEKKTGKRRMFDIGERAIQKSFKEV